MNDENKNIPIVEFDRLKTKIYSFIKEDDKGDKKKQKELIKTLPKKIMKNIKMHFLKRSKIRCGMKIIQNEFHQIGTYEINKISLSWFDYRRYILDDVM